MLNILLRPIKEAFQGFFRHFSMSFSSMVAVTVTLLLVSLFMVLTVNLQEITSTVDDKIQIHVQLDDSVEDETLIENRIIKMRGVISVEFSSKDNELDKFIESYGKEGVIFEMYRGENNPLKNAFIVELADNKQIESTTLAINNIEGVLKANYGGDATLRLVELLNSVRDGGLILVSALGVLALVLIVNTIKITIQSRAHEIQIMRTIGATNHFIRAPFIIEGFIIGLLGALIPIGLSIYGYSTMYTYLGGQFFSELFPLRAVFPFVLQLSYLLLMIGIVLGFLGSFISVSRFLRSVR